MTHASPGPRAKRADPQRTCIGCRRQTRQEGLLRLVRSPEGEVVVDHPRRLGGRGAYVCGSMSCLRRALKPSLLARSLGGAVSVPEFSDLLDHARGRVARRIDGLLASAGRARKVAIGAADTEAALRRGTATLVVLAADVSSRVRCDLEAAAQRSDVMVWEFGDKRRLGSALARSEVGAVALTDHGFAAAVRHELSLLAGLTTTQVKNETSRTRDEALERAT